MNVQHEDDGKKGAFFIKDEAIRRRGYIYTNTVKIKPNVTILENMSSIP